MHRVPVGQRVGKTVLPQVVADRHLAAKCIAAAFDHELVQIVGIRLDQDRHVKPRQLYRIGHALFVTKVGETDEDAVDLVGVAAKEVGAALGIAPGFDAAQLRRGVVEHNAVDIEIGKERADIIARLGAVGARPGAFNTVRYSEKLLQASGMTVTTLDLSEVLGWVTRLPEEDGAVAKKLADIKAYADYGSVPPPSLVKMAKLGVVIERWMDENDLVASAIQCWTSLQRNFGVNVCTLMSIMSERLMPSACEVDITGVVSMYAQQLASGRPSALVDWNNNYGDDPNKCVFFHCGNWAKSFIPDAAIKTAPILGTTLGEENTYGAMAGRTPSGPVTFARVSTDDVNGAIRTYVGEGRFTDDKLDTFGTRAVVEVPALQKLMKYICKNGFEHHVSMNGSLTAPVLAEAFSTYFGWDVYTHEG